MRVVSNTVRVVLTGASSGIGRALARELACCGCRLLLTARRLDRLQELADQLRPLSPEIRIVAGDISMSSTQVQVVDTVNQCWRGLDVLVNNAGVGAEGSFENSSLEELRQLFEVNFFAPAELTRRLLPLLRSRVENEAVVDGTTQSAESAIRASARSRRLHVPMIVNVGSVLGHRAAPWKVGYSASKFALHGLSDALRAELSPSGIRVLHVCPSTTQSEFFQHLLREDGSPRTQRHGMTTDFVACCIVSSMARGRHELILPMFARCVVWLDRLFPTVADALVAYYGHRLRKENHAKSLP